MRIDAVLFDLGGTLEDVRYSPESRLAACASLKRFLKKEGLDLAAEPEALLKAIERGYLAYRAWSERTMTEAPANRVWAEWYLREFDLPRPEIDRVAEGLALIWETEFHSRELRPDARESLEALKARGFRLGVISNTSSESQVLATLGHYGIRDYFDCLCLSCVSGIRKPDPRIFLEALCRLGVAPERAAYVGDTVSRDVSGSKAAGYALAFQIKSFMTAGRDSALPPGCPRPDYVVGELGEIAPILDGLGAGPAGAAGAAAEGAHRSMR